MYRDSVESRIDGKEERLSPGPNSKNVSKKNDEMRFANLNSRVIRR